MTLSAAKSKKLGLNLLELQEKYDSFGARPKVTAVDKAQMLDLIAQGANPHVKNLYGYTPLHLCRNPDLSFLIAPLLAAGAKVDARTDDRQSPLMCYLAGNYKNIDGARQLLAAGANPALKDFHGRDAVFYAWYREADAFKEELLDAIDAWKKAHKKPRSKKAIFDAIVASGVPAAAKTIAVRKLKPKGPAP